MIMTNEIRTTIHLCLELLFKKKKEKRKKKEKMTVFCTLK